MIVILIYELKKFLDGMAQGTFTRGAHIKAGGNAPLLKIVEKDGKKCIMITNRSVREDGITLLLPEMSELMPGDKLKITGYMGEITPNDSQWSVCLRSPRGVFNQVAQAIAPTDSFTVSYVLDRTDLPHPLFIHTNAWGSVVPDMDFYVENITITRPDNLGAMIDKRSLVYSMDMDDYLATFRPGDFLTPDPYSPLTPSGSPFCLIKRHRHGGKNAIHVGGRANDWDGLELRLDMLGLMPGNTYSVHIMGKIEGNAPPGTQIMIQIIPGYTWRDNYEVSSNQEFTLGHTLTLMELETADRLRITTNGEGAKIEFSISDIELTTGSGPSFMY